MKPIIPDAALGQHIAVLGKKEKQRAYFAKYRAEHPELKQYYAAYYQANKERWRERRCSEKSRDYMKAYRKKHRARLAEKLKAWHAANPERSRQIEKKHQVARRPRKQLADRRYRQERPEAYRASIARAKAAKPSLYRQIAVRSALTRRARKKSAVVERVSLQRIVQRDRGRCHLCFLPAALAERSFDHLIPVARRGAHAEWNLMLAHTACNQRRGTRQILPAETREAAEAYIASRAHG